MEEKERYELFGEHCIKDNNPDARCQLLDAYLACVILNEQDKENHQLKQQLHDLPNKIVEEIKKVSDTVILWWSSEVYDYTITAKNLDTILKKYGGKYE